MSNLKGIQVGEYIYTQPYYNSDIRLHKVERITKTLAITKSHRFNLESGKVLGTKGWNCLFGYKSTPKIMEKYKIQISWHYIESKYKSITDSQAVTLAGIIKDMLKENTQEDTKEQGE